MKTTITILAAVLVLSTSALFAGNETSSIPTTTENPTFAMEFLAPVAPAEATFEDFVAVNEIANLVPVTPSEASFEEMPVDETSVFDLAPVVPTQADFEDVVAGVIVDNGILAPVTPSVDFE